MNGRIVLEWKVMGEIDEGMEHQRGEKEGDIGPQATERMISLSNCLIIVDLANQYCQLFS